MSSLIIQGVSYAYNGTKVIDNLDLTLGKDEIVCLLGASGCGKTTTLKAIAGLIEAKQAARRAVTTPPTWPCTTPAWSTTTVSSGGRRTTAAAARRYRC